jgi:hypothetical protein
MCDQHAPVPAQARATHLHRDAGPGDGPLPASHGVKPPPRRRLKLWELEDKHHCPVIGTCLTLAELEKLARRTGYAGRQVDAYALHVEAVSLSMERNLASETMQKWLERKFAAVIGRFEKAKTDAAVLALWKSHLERGEVAGAVWAALTHKEASVDTRHVVYADLHMLSHQVGAGQAADLRRLEWLEAELERSRAALSRESARYGREAARNAARIRQLEHEAAAAARRAEADSPLRARLEALESGTAMIEVGRKLMRLNDEVGHLRKQVSDAERGAERLKQLEDENARLAAERDEAAAERDALERLWLDETAPEPGCRVGCAACPNPLSGRCVLCVGGRTPLLPQYRQLAERLGVRLIHHDGGREEALSRLPDLLAASDAVICPTDCVGHPAYYQLKRHCKQIGKPCVLARSSGVASFAAALARLADGRAEIPGEQP